jgi:hypothetical protein
MPVKAPSTNVLVVYDRIADRLTHPEVTDIGW